MNSYHRPWPRPQMMPHEAGLHRWVRVKSSEPLRCTKCGTYYASPKGMQPCPANHEAA